MIFTLENDKAIQLLRNTKCGFFVCIGKGFGYQYRFIVHFNQYGHKYDELNHPFTSYLEI